MVLATFTNLPNEKQVRIRKALFTEFEEHPLADAQVARIVKESSISRGAFYKYFSDLTDAYKYVFDFALEEIHQKMPARATSENVDFYLQRITNFVTETDQAGYRNFIKMYYLHNENYLGSKPTQIDSDRWAFKILYHQTLRDVILDPTSLDTRLDQLKSVLQKL
ncbi:TetR/AcrR family transcriptional regulator [Weissella thailandensis]|uniref:TetR/AcrR family transcriptional regulator n=1 Tax=Weissella thailandensis TaxID=89061 RepID=A0ABX9I1X5_9LACO|nr:TetR/AcrR family transcriptional regulator [Weissella thailandensis]NKY90256.1 TetR/AcrR family transcriptional regulator [Weissella thailandensis]RDS58699.1 TetR/AcrR family transcriptional regulator [Weissella thailandensis]GEP75563.1 transcriptional regulator [Weissella thailandensis]